MKHTLHRQVYPPYIAIIVCVIAALSLSGGTAIRSFSHAEKKRELAREAALIASLVPDALYGAGIREADALVDSLRRVEGIRVTVVRPDGTVLADSQEDPLQMENHADRPEVFEALRGGEGLSVRHSATLTRDMMYVAVPVVRNDAVLAVIRVASSLADINAPLRDLYLRSGLTGLIVALLTAAVSYFIVRRISAPLSSLRSTAERYARGELDLHIAVDRPEELRVLALTMNGMADQLRARIRTVTDQRNELEGILSSMVEAVILLDGSMKVRTVNTAARTLFAARDQRAEGKTLIEYSGNSDLLEFAERTLSSDRDLEQNITLYGERRVDLQAHGTVLRSADEVGVLLVLHDVSRLVRLEEVRKDFVANVSHELRTPITSILGFVETLNDGAIDDPETARRFLSIISRHAQRLMAVIEDLLALSRLEQDGREAVRFERTDVRSVVEGAAALYEPRSQAKRIAVDLVMPGHEVAATVSPVLLEQAVLNLLDNAVKYSDEGGSVRVTVREESSDILISVSDDGCGIPSRDLPRIFERFYRVDKARSRALGGTGLGLAIVKHIMNVHGGDARVESTPGKGSTFTLRLPRDAAQPSVS